MSLERAIHELWSADFRLTALVPAGRLCTGAAAGPAELPYVVLTRQGNKPSVRTSSGRAVDETAVRFTVWSMELDLAKRIAAEISRRFDRLDFERHGVRCLNIWRTHDAAALEADGIWRLPIDFVALNEPC